MKVAIHQPDFFPWLGYFHKLNHADTFVHFDHVASPMGKSWASRNKILVGGKVQWITIPTKKKGKAGQKYFEIEINYNSNFIRKHLGTIRQSYGKCPFFNKNFPLIEELYDREYRYLVEFNVHFIELVSENLGFKKSFLSSRQMSDENADLKSSSGNDLVLFTCLHARATEYIAGEGCLDFIKPGTFIERGIKFFFQRFECKEYPQSNNNSSFVSHLSILDALFNVGFNGVKELISENMLDEVLN